MAVHLADAGDVLDGVDVLDEIWHLIESVSEGCMAHVSHFECNFCS